MKIKQKNEQKHNNTLTRKPPKAIKNLINSIVVGCIVSTYKLILKKKKKVQLKLIF